MIDVRHAGFCQAAGDGVGKVGNSPVSRLTIGTLLADTRATIKVARELGYWRDKAASRRHLVYKPS